MTLASVHSNPVFSERYDVIVRYNIMLRQIRLSVCDTREQIFSRIYYFLPPGSPWTWVFCKKKKPDRDDVHNSYTLFQ